MATSMDRRGAMLRGLCAGHNPAEARTSQYLNAFASHMLNHLCPRATKTVVVKRQNPLFKILA